MNWIRQTKSAKERVKEDLDRKETDLRSSAGYKEIYEDDKAAIIAFRLAGDLGEFPGASIDDDDNTLGVSTVRTGANTVASQTATDPGIHTEENSIVRESTESRNRSSAISRRPISKSGGGSVSSASIRSKFSSSQSLSPLDEGDEDAKDDDNLIPHNTEDTYDDDDVSQLSLSPRRSKTVK